MSDKLVNAIADMDEDQALALVQEMLANGTDPVTILDDIILSLCINRIDVMQGSLKPAAPANPMLDKA